MAQKLRGWLEKKESSLVAVQALEPPQLAN
jgi:hypothetical protein